MPITVICLLFPGLLADALGANVILREPLISYIIGYAIGIIPQLLAQQLASFLQMERQNILLRIRDDCIPFNPHEWIELVEPKDAFSNIGIRMVYRLTKDVSYQNTQEWVKLRRIE